MRSDHYDVIVIGTGAGGGSVLSKLAPTGRRILVLERGDYLPREKRNWDVRAVQQQRVYDVGENWRDREGQSFAPGVKYVVGGNTKFWGAALLRMRPSDFEEVAHFGGRSPAWPIRYDELEPYYLEAETLFRVRGRRGVDPTEGPASGPYAFPAIRHEPEVKRWIDDFASLGVKAWELPLGVLLSEEAGARSECIRCDTCDGFPCLVRGKADAQTICVEPALAYPNVTLLRGARADRLLTDRSGRAVTSVEVDVAGERAIFTADVFVVAAGAIQSTALLLRSRSDAHRNGLGNSSGLLGRHYMTHQNSAVFALSARENRSTFQKTFAISDWYHAGVDREFPLGLVQPLNRTPAALLEASPPPFATDPRKDAAWLASHSIEFWTTSEDLPDPNNQVRLAADGTIVVDYRANNVEAHDRLNAQLAEVITQIEHRTGNHGFDPRRDFAVTRMPLSVCSHQCGTMRFGQDPRAAVLDVDCRMHDLDNVFVVDASFFPSSAAVNPSLTIIANALRVGDRLRARLT